MRSFGHRRAGGRARRGRIPAANLHPERITSLSHGSECSSATSPYSWAYGRSSEPFSRSSQFIHEPSWSPREQGRSPGDESEGRQGAPSPTCLSREIRQGMRLSGFWDLLSGPPRRRGWSSDRGPRESRVCSAAMAVPEELPEGWLQKLWATEGRMKWAARAVVVSVVVLSPLFGLVALGAALEDLRQGRVGRPGGPGPRPRPRRGPVGDVAAKRAAGRVIGVDGRCRDCKQRGHLAKRHAAQGFRSRQPRPR